ncbi:MAG: OpgC domain-containing protein [Pseudomonadota bacterium]
MALADPSITYSSPATARKNVSQAGVRDPRLDFFRGIAMFIILVAHVPNDWLALWIPARFGFSDATEIFVFCSGMASAIAFGRVFRERGMAMGSARVAYRVWQVYWAHVALFVAIAATMVALNALFPEGRDYVGQLNLHPFFRDPQSQLLGLLTLTYVPNYFDILPMYLVILAMMPIMIALAQVHIGLAALVSVAVWLSASVFDLNLPAEPWSERQWFFNPFGWQLIFFTGFALMARWIPAPPRDWRLLLGALAIVLVVVPFAYFRIYNAVPFFLEWRRDWSFLITKSDFGVLRYVHFLALAYVCWILVGLQGSSIQPGESDHIAAKSWRVLLGMITKVGQQSLAVFIASMYFARIMGVIFDAVGRTHWSMFWVNMLGFAAIIIVAYSVAWLKAQPWKTKKPA